MTTNAKSSQAGNDQRCKAVPASWIQTVSKERLEIIAQINAWQHARQKKRPLSIRFCLRPRKAGEPFRPLVFVRVRIYVNGVEGVAISTGIKVAPAYWDQKGQCVIGQSGEAIAANKVLAEMKAKIELVHATQLSRKDNGVGWDVTAATVKNEFVTGRPPQTASISGAGGDESHPIYPGILLVEAYRAYIAHLGEEQRAGRTMHKTTFGRWKYGITQLEHFLAGRNPRCEELTIAWARQYHAWLLRQPNPQNKARRLGVTTATRAVRRIGVVLDFMIDMAGLSVNPLFTLKLPKSPDKEVYFLEPEHLERLFDLHLIGTDGAAVWWMKLFCLTGLDYPDAVLYAQNQQKYERLTPNGRKIVISRSKTPHGECHIPILPELEALFEEYPKGPHRYASQRLNIAIRDTIAPAIGFDRHLTIKIGRKTAGALFLRKGYRMEAVSKILGHATVAITERHYVKVSGSLVDVEMKRLSVISLSGQ